MKLAINHLSRSLSRTLLGGLFLISTGLLAAGCARSEEDVQRDFAEVVAASNACSDVSECVIVSPGCPLACSAAVNADSKDEVEAKAKALINDYQRGGRSCAYDCVGSGPLICEQGHCGFGAEL